MYPCAGRHIPDVHRPVRDRRGQVPAVGPEGYPADLPPLDLEGTDFLAPEPGVPELHAAIAAARCEELAVGTQRQVPDVAGMAERPRITVAQPFQVVPFP